MRVFVSKRVGKNLKNVFCSFAEQKQAAKTSNDDDNTSKKSLIRIT